MNPVDLLRVRVEDVKLTLAAAELRVQLLDSSLAAGTELRGRLVGPRNRYASTVEIAYPLQPCWPLLRNCQRVAIPEPNLWSPTSPFLYRGTVELWMKGERTAEVAVQHGLRTTMLGPAGLRWNGQPLVLRGRECGPEPPSSSNLLAWRQEGCNCLLVAAPSAYRSTCALADEFGFLAICRVRATEPRVCWGLQAVAGLELSSVSALALLLDQEVAEEVQPSEWEQNMRVLERKPVVYPGVELRHLPTQPLPNWIRWVACAPALLPALSWLGLPKLLLTDAEEGKASAVPGILGWVCP